MKTAASVTTAADVAASALCMQGKDCHKTTEDEREERVFTHGCHL